MVRLQNFSLSVADSDLIKDLSFSVDKGNILTIMGPSGCGKTSLLLYIAGFTSEGIKAEGEVYLDDVCLTSIPPEHRQIGLLFQDDLLFPHLTVLNNLMIGIKNDVSAKDKKSLAMNALKECELDGYENRHISTLSGGQKARLSLWRTLLSEPKAILLDEPFAKLDKSLKEKVREYFLKHITSRKVPTILVSHDQSDAEWARGDLINFEDF